MDDVSFTAAAGGGNDRDRSSITMPSVLAENLAPTDMVTQRRKQMPTIAFRYGKVVVDQPIG